MNGMVTKMIRISIKFLNSQHHLSFVVTDDANVGEIVAELLRDLGKTFADVEDVKYGYIKK